MSCSIVAFLFVNAFVAVVAFIIGFLFGGGYP